jgi:hypothetical protein
VINAKALAHQIMGIEIEHENGEFSDNIAIMLATCFENSTCHPEDRSLDEYDTWTQWASDQVDLVEAEIAKLIEEAITKNETNPRNPISQ